MIKCPKCGNIIENESAKFCKKCGTKLQVPTIPKEEEVKQEPEAAPAGVSQPITSNPVKEEKPKVQKTVSPQNSNSSNQNVIWAVVIIVAVLAIGGLGFLFMQDKETDYSALSPESGREQLKQEILSSIKELDADASDDSLAIMFSSNDIKYIVQIDEDHYDPMYVTIGAYFELSEEYDSDIARRAAVNAAGSKPVYCDCIDNLLIFDCEMYLKGSKPFTSVLPNMVNAIKSSVERFDSEYEKAKKIFKKQSTSVTSNLVDLRTESPKIYNNPSHSTSSDNKLHVTKVYWEGGNTVLEFLSYNGGEYQWCSIEKGAYLMADGTKYPLTRAEGIAYAPNHTDYPNYQSGNNVSMTFKLYFSAIPTTTRIFDFYESSTSGWIVKSIKLED